MNIIIPMAGLGKRLRPQTLTTPKPLLPIAGKPIVQHLVEDIAAIIPEKIDEIGFVTGHFGENTEQQLLAIAEAVGARGSIHYQDNALGTAHAILCAGSLLNGKVMIAYADTLFKAGFELDTEKEAVIWVSNVENPEQFGVVERAENGSIVKFHEKPALFVSDLAIIGIYYFRDGDNLAGELKYLLDQQIKTSGEYGITDALQNMINKGLAFQTEIVERWMDCGNKEAVLDTHRHVLDYKQNQTDVITADFEDAIIIEPCHIPNGVKISQSVIGPYVSIGKNSVIQNAIIRNTIIQENAMIENKLIENSIIGNFTTTSGQFNTYNIGDYNQLG